MTPQDFEELANIYHPRLVRSAIKRWGDEGEDVVQEAFLRALNSLDSFKHDSSFSTWIFGICLNIRADANKTAMVYEDVVWSNWICPSCGTWHQLQDYLKVEE